MPRNAKVFLVEDNPFLKKVESLWIESDGHKVVLEASSLGEALEKVKLAKEKKLMLESSMDLFVVKIVLPMVLRLPKS